MLNIRKALCRTVLLVLTLLAELVHLPCAIASKPIRVYPDTLVVTGPRYSLFRAMRPARKTVGLALSGGGASGLSQIGVLKAFDEEGIPIDGIAGTSMGAIIGGLYSCGYTPAELEEIVMRMPWESIISFSDDYTRSNIFLEQQRIRDRASFAIRLKKFSLLIPRSLNSAQKMTSTIDLLALNALYHPAKDFSSLPVNFRAVSTDLVSGARITLFSGSLSEAMRASSTIPILCEPIARGSYQLVDGGLVANLPVDELENFHTEYNIAVDTHGSMYATGEELDLPWKAADQAMTILTKLQYPAQLAKADMVITPDIAGHKATDFSHISTLVEAGYIQGKIAAKKIKKQICKKSSRGIAIGSCLKKAYFLHDNPRLEAMVSAVLCDATDLDKTLQELLETDLFIRLHAEFDKRRKKVVFSLEPLPQIKKVTVAGGPVDALSSDEIESSFTLLTGKLYTNAAATRALESLIKNYRRKGYTFVSIAQTTVANGLLKVTLTPGNTAGIEISRDKNITEITPILREIKVDTTQALQLRRAEESVNNLYETGVFSRVSISAEERPDSVSGSNQAVRFSLDEKAVSVLRLGFRYDETNNAQFLVDIRNENVEGTTNSTGGWLKAGRDSYLANMEFFMPRIGATHLTMSSRLFYDQHEFEHREEAGRNISNYGIQKYGISHAFGTRIRKNGQLLADFTLQNSQSYMAKERSGTLQTSSRTIFSVGTQLTLDSRNSALMPTSGSCTNLRYVLTAALLDNEDLFWQLSGSHEKNIHLAPDVTLQLSGLFGLSSNNMLLSEKFFLGGFGTTYSQRFIGLKENAIACNNMAAAGIQIGYKPSFDIIFPASLFLHYNVGNVWNKRGDISPDSLIQGIGTSVIWETPLGHARLGAAKIIPLSEQLQTDTILYFSLGHNF